MSSSNDRRSSRRRVGRKRLPPLAPGPSIQFVVANHPDDFRAGDTMRNVRSHVMYQHREQRGNSPADNDRSREGSNTPAITAHTPSPTTTSLRDAAEHSAYLTYPAQRSVAEWGEEIDEYSSGSYSTRHTRDLITQLIPAITSGSAEYTPLIFDEPSEFPFAESHASAPDSIVALKQEYIHTTGFFCHDLTWMHNVCAHRLSFLSHVSVACVYQDLERGLLYDSELTIYAKSKVLQAITNGLGTDDVTILSIIHLLISEIGCFSEDTFDMHVDGLNKILVQRGGVGQLHSSLSTHLTLITLCFTILRGTTDPLILSHTSADTALPTLHIGDILGPPVHSEETECTRYYATCSAATNEIIHDMHSFSHTYLDRCIYLSNNDPASIAQVASCDIQLQQIYTRLTQYPSTKDDLTPDWIYESVRLAALLYCDPIGRATIFTDATGSAYERDKRDNSNDIALLSALYAAIIQTDTRSCWGDMRAVCLRVCLIGGEASMAQNESTTAQMWMRKWFALNAVRAAVSIPFDGAGAMTQGLRNILQVRRWVDVRGVA